MTSRFYLAGLVLVAMLVVALSCVKGAGRVDMCCFEESERCNYRVCAIDDSEKKLLSYERGLQ